MPAPTTEVLRRRFDALQRDFIQLRAMVLGDTGQLSEDPNGWIRFTRLLEAFVEADLHRLLAGEVSTLATRLGYNPRGTSGFYRGGYLRVEGDYRVLTEAGMKAYRDNAHRLRGSS